MKKDVITIIQADVEPMPENPNYYTHEAGKALWFSRGGDLDPTKAFIGYLLVHKWRVLGETHMAEISSGRFLVGMPRELLEEVALRPFHVVIGAHQVGESPEVERWISEVFEGTKS